MSDNEIYSSIPAPEMPAPPVSNNENNVILAKFIINGEKVVYINTCDPKYKKELFMTFPDQTSCVNCEKTVKYGTGIMDPKNMENEVRVYFVIYIENNFLIVRGIGYNYLD